MREEPIEIDWIWLDDGDEEWRAARCLYAYLAPRTREILYIGKAWGTTVRERWSRGAKPEFWDDLERERGIYWPATLAGLVHPPGNLRLTQELLCDSESLLIQQVGPWGNIQSRTSRIPRPGMTLRCRGDWPHSKKLYRDL
ncbi:MAG TPA: hypothetical protein VJ646_02575 [Candidatus Binatia bacterium]|nr:hypothetical protein [Candidatus Binatia bacterium]